MRTPCRDMVARAKNMSEQFAQEDGIVGAVDAFYKHLPLTKILCDVSIGL